MSRNKDIKLLHEMTGRSYKECRAIMKANHWCLWSAYGAEFSAVFDNTTQIIGNMLDGLSEAIWQMAEATRHMVDSLADAISNIDIEQLKELQEYEQIPEIQRH